jgi:hypothetical protein
MTMVHRDAIMSRMRYGGARSRGDSREAVFRRLTASLRELEPDTGDNYRCPLCWQTFPGSSVKSELTIEHVAPVAAARLMRELSSKTLTCTSCNNTYGSRLHSQLKKFLISQLHLAGKYDKPIRGTISVPNLTCPQ